MQVSVELVGRALKITPAAAMAHFHMAEALRMLERLAEAEESYARAISLRPEFAEAHCARRCARRDEPLEGRA
jgi:Tfp pilus assembly protein PilF